MSTASRARSAGRRFASGAGQTGLAMAGGAVYYGAHALLTPTLYGSDAANIPKRSWMLPVAGIIGGHLLSKVSRVGTMGAGLAGGAVAIGIEQVQLAISIKKNQAASATTGTSGVGALVEPADIRALPAAQTGYVDESGALWAPPDARHEAAGLSL